VHKGNVLYAHILAHTYRDISSHNFEAREENMMHWLITAGLVTIAYSIGRKHGEADCIKFFDRTLNRVAVRLGVPSDHDYWSEDGFYKWLMEVGTAMKRNRETQERSEQN
jgi:hypothetical protein